jgi:GMP synthase-like glutamine amidotransferase
MANISYYFVTILATQSATVKLCLLLLNNFISLQFHPDMYVPGYSLSV